MQEVKVSEVNVGAVRQRDVTEMGDGEGKGYEGERERDRGRERRGRRMRRESERESERERERELKEQNPVQLYRKTPNSATFQQSTFPWSIANKNKTNQTDPVHLSEAN